MFKPYPGFPVAVLIGLLLFAPTRVLAFDDFATNVFKFQLKLAESGQLQSQYKLGRMYETGRGTEKDIDKAMHWYSVAAGSGFEPAADRITYYEVKQFGYDAARYGEWVDSIIANAKQRVPESMALLSQMYIEGIGVRQSDRSALRLLMLLSMDGVSEVDADIAALEAKLAASGSKKQANKVVLRAARPGTATDSAAGTSIAKAAQPSTAAATQGIADSIEQELIAKKRRYEAVMKQLQEEQQLLEQQQQWAESEL